MFPYHHSLSEVLLQRHLLCLNIRLQMIPWPFNPWQLKWFSPNFKAIKNRETFKKRISFPHGLQCQVSSAYSDESVKNFIILQYLELNSYSMLLRQYTTKNFGRKRKRRPTQEMQEAKYGNLEYPIIWCKLRALWRHLFVPSVLKGDKRQDEPTHADCSRQLSLSSGRQSILTTKSKFLAVQRIIWHEADK